MFKQLYLGELKERSPQRQTFVPGISMYSLSENNELKRRNIQLPEYTIAEGTTTLVQ